MNARRAQRLMMSLGHARRYSASTVEKDSLYDPTSVSRIPRYPPDTPRDRNKRARHRYGDSGRTPSSERSGRGEADERAGEIPVRARSETGCRAREQERNKGERRLDEATGRWKWWWFGKEMLRRPPLPLRQHNTHFAKAHRHRRHRLALVCREHLAHERGTEARASVRRRTDDAEEHRFCHFRLGTRRSQPSGAYPSIRRFLWASSTSRTSRR